MSVLGSTYGLYRFSGSKYCGNQGPFWDEQGALISRADIPHRQITNAASWVSHDAEELYRNLGKAVRQALHKAAINPVLVGVIGISNQREMAFMQGSLYREGALRCRGLAVWRVGFGMVS